MNEQELADIALCYQSMGIPLDATPAEIDQIYRKITIGNKKQYANSDPGLREEAKQSQELVEEMMGKIRASATYRAMEKDYLKKVGDAPAGEPQETTPSPAAASDRSGRVVCPRCQGSILKGLKTCPICQAPLQAGQQSSSRPTSFFTPTKIVLIGLVLVAVTLALFSILHGETEKGGLSDLDSLQQKIAPK